MAASIRYLEIFETLKMEILGGKYASCRSFPSAMALAIRFKTTRATVRRALDHLRNQGLVGSRQGASTYLTKAAKSRKIGLILPGVAYSEFFPPIVSEISRLSQKEDYNLLLGDVSSKSPEKRVVAAKKISCEFVRQGVAGVLYQPLELVDDVQRVNKDVLSVFDKAGIPVVIIDNDFVSGPHRAMYAYDAVGIDNVTAGAIAAEHLIELGVRRLAFQKRPKCSSSVNDRCRGVVSAFRFRTQTLKTSVLVAEPDDVNALRRHLRRFKPEAFVCGNDSAAVALKQSFERLGKRVPDDVLLVGFDDLKFAKIVSPQLTTVRQPCEKIAETAFYRLLAKIVNPMLTPVRILLPVDLVVRESTKRVVHKRLSTVRQVDKKECQK